MAPPLIYALALVLGLELSCLLPHTTCTFGKTFTPLESLALMLLGFSVIAVAIYFLVGYPVVALLRLVDLDRWWIVAPLAVAIGLLPLITFCVGNCLEHWTEIVIWGTAGLAAGLCYLAVRRAQARTSGLSSEQ